MKSKIITIFAAGLAFSVFAFAKPRLEPLPQVVIDGFKACSYVTFDTSKLQASEAEIARAYAYFMSKSLPTHCDQMNRFYQISKTGKIQYLEYAVNENSKRISLVFSQSTNEGTVD